MRRKAQWIAAFSLALCVFSMLPREAAAAWIWSPDIGKWINPKKSAKDTPEDQYAWALQFYQQKNWDRAIEEFEKLPAVFPNSRLAAEGVYYTGICWEEKQDLAKAADNYQKLIDRYPYSDRIKDAIRREFEIANQFAGGEKMKVLGLPALSGQDKAVELYTHIVRNAPFGTYGDQAQYKIGEVYKNQGEYDEARKAFQAVVDEYPNSELVSKARYQIAYSSMQESKKSQYNEQSAQQAIEEFQGFKNAFPTDQQSVEADESIKALRSKKAETNMEVAEFYEKQNKLSSAEVYYREVASKYPDTPYARTAKKKLDEMVRKRAGEPSEQPKKKFLLW